MILVLAFQNRISQSPVPPKIRGNNASVIQHGLTFYQISRSTPERGCICARPNRVPTESLLPSPLPQSRLHQTNHMMLNLFLPLLLTQDNSDAAAMLLWTGPNGILQTHYSKNRPLVASGKRCVGRLFGPLRTLPPRLAPKLSRLSKRS